MSRLIGRYFVGLDLSGRDKLTLETWRKQCLPQALGKWIPMANFHITLSFIGGVRASQMETIGGQLLAIQCPPFQLAVGSMGVFVKPQTLYLSINLSQPLSHLADQCRRVNAVINVQQAHRAYFSHITLLRKHREVLPLNAEPPILDLSFHQFHLFESMPAAGKGKSPNYVKRMTFDLSDGAARRARLHSDGA